MPKSDLVPLTSRQLRLLGEVIVLHGIIAAQLEALGGLIAHVKNAKWKNVVRHGSLAQDFKSWAEQTRTLCAGDDAVLEVVDRIQAKLTPNLIDRSDFVHAAFGALQRDGSTTLTNFDPRTGMGAGAMRLGKKQPIRDADELRPARDEAEAIAKLLIALHELLAARMT